MCVCVNRRHIRFEAIIKQRKQIDAGLGYMDMLCCGHKCFCGEHLWFFLFKVMSSSFCLVRVSVRYIYISLLDYKI